MSRHTVDLDILANDIADVLAGDEYRFDVDSTDVRHALEAFIADVEGHAHAHPTS